MVNLKIGPVIVTIKQLTCAFRHLTAPFSTRKRGGDNKGIADKIIDRTLPFGRRSGPALGFGYEFLEINRFGELSAKFVRHRLWRAAFFLGEEQLFTNSTDCQQVANFDPSHNLATHPRFWSATCAFTQ